MNKKAISVLLVICLLVGLTSGLSVGANGGTMDMDGDGQLTIHDVQLAKEIEANKRTRSQRQNFALADYSASEVLNKLLGKSYTPEKKNGVYQISKKKDLFFVQDNSTKGYSYALTADIDLEGMDWTPIDDFTGTFDGNGHTISNAVITDGVAGNTNKKIEDQGFFSEILADSVVKDLNLRNIEITASSKAMFIGLLCGTNRGTVTGCFTHGKITDRREGTDHIFVNASGQKSEGSTTKIAALIGRCVGNGTYDTVKGVYADEPTAPDGNRYTLRSTAQSAVSGVNDSAVQIAAQLALDLADRSDIHVSLCGFEKTASTLTGATQFQEISGTYGVTDAMKEKQDKVVDYMYQEGTVKWTTPVDLTEVDHGTSVYVSANTVQTGIPFKDYFNSLERFLYVARDTNNDGILELNSQYANETDPNWYNSTNHKDAGDAGENGWVRYVGNDCSGAIAWAWLQISPVDCYNSETGVLSESCRHIFAWEELDENHTDHYGHRHGIVQIGEYDFFETDSSGNITEKFLSATKAEKTDSDGDGKVSVYLDGKYATTSADLWDWNANTGKTETNEKYAKLYATYGQLRKGDAIHCWFTGDKATYFQEDANGNFVLDAGEDKDGDGRLDWHEDLNGNGVRDADEPDLNGNGELDGATDVDKQRVWEGHMRLLAEDPVIIRDKDGYVNIESSYVITHGHGGGVWRRQTQASNDKSGSYNEWYLYQKYFLTDLDYEVGICTNGNDSSRCYLPITCSALRTEGVEANKITVTTTEGTVKKDNIEYAKKVTAPWSGLITSYYSPSEITVEINTADTKTNLISKTVCHLPDAGVNSTQNQNRFYERYLRNILLQEIFSDLETDSRLTSGTQYSFRFQIKTVNDHDGTDWGEDITYTTDWLTYTHP